MVARRTAGIGATSPLAAASANVGLPPTPAVHPDRPEREVCAGLPPFQGDSVLRAAGAAAPTVHLRQLRPAKSLYFHTPDRALRSPSCCLALIQREG
jgi:hypothetical protein